MYKKTLVYWIIYSLSFIYVELMFALFSHFAMLSFSRVRTILFSMSFALLLAIITALLPKKAASKTMYGLMFFHAFYVLFQSVFFDYMGYYLSANTAKTTAVNVTEFAWDFITSINLKYVLYFLPMIVIYLAIKTKFLTLPKRKIVLKEVGAYVVILVLIHVVSLFSLTWFVSKVQVYTPKELYRNPSHAYLAIQELGVNRYGVRDLWRVFFKVDADPIIITPDDPIDNPSDPEVPDLARTVKTSAWMNLRDLESNNRIKQIDDYLLAKEVPPKNEMTGYFKDKNLVYIMVEAFDYMAIDPELTPTLYQLMQEGWFFENHYAVKGSCATGESEFMGLLSLIPSVSVCTPFEYSKNDFNASVFNLFRNKGYHASSYHSFVDQFYPRTPWHKNMGSEFFYTSDQLKIPMLKGWPSDVTLFENSYEVYSKQTEPFMAFVITASMHFPYDSDSNLGNRYLNLVNQVKPDVDISIKRYLSKSIEFDRGLKRLFELFEEDGLMDDTVFIIYADHHPFRIDNTVIAKNTSYVDRLGGLNIDRSPLIIYSKDMAPKRISTPSSQIDILPTIANLFDLDYDPRLYLGQDLFSSDDNLVIFTSGSWKTNKGEFLSSKQEFYPYNENVTYTEEEIAKLNQYVKNRFMISEEILQTDYYHYRFSILP